MGGRPILALALVGMPINVLSTATIGRILEGGASVCRAAGIPIAGGHTIDSVEAIYGLVALGLVHPDHVKRNADARPGDLLVLGKSLGVGVMSAAFKKGELGDAGYAQMIATTTRLNTPGPALAALPGVHALTDVTGFGLAGHALEMARGAKCEVHLDWRSVPLLPGVRELAVRGFVTEDRALLTDPQTSGGLLVACDPAALDEVLRTFREQGFEQAAVVGEVGAARGAPGVRVSA
jgi:selenide,water dikinase